MDQVRPLMREQRSHDCASLDWPTGPHPTPSGSGLAPTADRSKTPAAGSRSRGIDSTGPVTEDQPLGIGVDGKARDRDVKAGQRQGEGDSNHGPRLARAERHGAFNQRIRPDFGVAGQPDLHRGRRYQYLAPIAPALGRVEDGRGGLGHAATPRFPSPLIKPDVRICRVAQPLLAFAPTDPIVRRYRNGLFRTDLRRMNHPCHA